MYTLIIVDYQSLDKTISYIGHCWKNLGSQGAGHVVIVENGAPQKPLEELTGIFGTPHIRECEQVGKTLYIFEQDGQQIVYCESGGNLGYAKGNNLGAKIADALWDDPFYIISNNDLYFAAPLELSTINRLFAECPDAAVVGPKVVTPTGEQQSPRVWSSLFHRLIMHYWVSAFGSLLGKKKQKQLFDKWCKDTVMDAATGPYAWISGCFMFVRTESFRQIGGFDEHTFLYAEEMILSKRMEAIGKKVYFCREVEVIHQHAETTKKSIAALRSMQIDFEANCYCYKTYLGASKIGIACAKVSFGLYMFLLKIKQRLKK